MNKDLNFKSIILRFVLWTMVVILFNWFINEIFEIITPFLMLIPIILLLLWSIGYLIWAIVIFINYVKNGIIKSLIPLLFWITTILIWVLFPFGSMKVNLEYNLYTDERIEAIHMIQNNELTNDGIGNILLPLKFKHLSVDGQARVYQNDSNGTIIGFWVYRGILTGPYTSVIYTSYDTDLNESDLGGAYIISSIKLGKHWYFIKAE